MLARTFRAAVQRHAGYTGVVGRLSGIAVTRSPVMRILQISGLPGPPGLRHSSTHPVVSDGELPLPASTADGMPRIPASPSALLTTVREYRQKYPACVLLVRVGDFYELYYEQADEVGGDVLGL
ncbi:hypothetical protein IWW50_006321, partial [Coemansia erecta]